MLSNVIGVLAQSAVNVQVKVYDVKLNPVVGVELMVDNTTSIRTNNKGVVYTTLQERSLPPKNIEVLNRELEVESWNYSKGILEIILRKKSFQDVEISILDLENKPVPGIQVTVNSINVNVLTTNVAGKISVRLPLSENLDRPALFRIAEYTIVRRTRNGTKVNLTVEEIKKEIPVVVFNEKPIVESVEELDVESPEDIGLNNLDSITSLTVLYSVIKKVNYVELDTVYKNQLDTKFNELMHLNSQSTLRSINAMGIISDSTIIDNDIQVVVEKIKIEKQMLDNARLEFEAFTNQIETKLEEGGQNLSIEERKQLIQLVLNLKEMLRRNEELFYRNNEFYKEEVDALLGQLANIHELEDLLSQSEETYSKTKTQLIYVFFGFASFIGLSILLMYLVKTLKSQKMQLTMANKEINRINSNLEGLVEEKTESLEMINNELDTFLYRSSHNLRRPLTSIRGLASIAEITLGSEAISLFDKVVLTTKEMEKMLDKLTMMNHINQPVNFGQIDINKSIENLKSQFAETISANNISFKTSIQDNIAFNSFPIVIEIMLANLLENALFFSRYNQDKNPEVILSFSQNSRKKLLISVHDNGCGINPEIHEKIWDMFFIGSDSSKGNGLGLFISKKAVEALYGEIKMTSIVGQYCDFNITLPTLKKSKRNFKPNKR